MIFQRSNLSSHVPWHFGHCFLWVSINYLLANSGRSSNFNSLSRNQQYSALLARSLLVCLHPNHMRLCMNWYSIQRLRCQEEGLLKLLSCFRYPSIPWCWPIMLGWCWPKITLSQIKIHCSDGSVDPLVPDSFTRKTRTFSYFRMSWGNSIVYNGHIFSIGRCDHSTIVAFRSLTLHSPSKTCFESIGLWSLFGGDSDVRMLAFLSSWPFATVSID